MAEKQKIRRLLAPPTAEGVIALSEAITGKRATPEAKAEVKAMFQKAAGKAHVDV
jgi:hypothetical protein